MSEPVHGDPRIDQEIAETLTQLKTKFYVDGDLNTKVFKNLSLPLLRDLMTVTGEINLSAGRWFGVNHEKSLGGARKKKKVKEEILIREETGFLFDNTLPGRTG